MGLFPCGSEEGSQGHEGKVPEGRLQVNTESMLTLTAVQRMRGNCGGFKLLYVDELGSFSGEFMVRTWRGWMVLKFLYKCVWVP